MALIPTRSRVPQSLLVRDIGGIQTGPATRKANFLHVSRRFLGELQGELGVRGLVETAPGPKASSGVARLKSDHLVIELSEPATRDGLRVRCEVHGAAQHEVAATEEPIAPLAEQEAFADFLYRVRQMLKRQDEQGERANAPAASGDAGLFD